MSDLPWDDHQLYLNELKAEAKRRVSELIRAGLEEVLINMAMDARIQSTTTYRRQPGEPVRVTVRFGLPGDRTRMIKGTGTSVTTAIADAVKNLNDRIGENVSMV